MFEWWIKKLSTGITIYIVKLLTIVKWDFDDDVDDGLSGYGMTEFGPAALCDEIPSNIGTVGKPVPNTLCKVTYSIWIL